jgi:dienelactone hydrolase
MRLFILLLSLVSATATAANTLQLTRADGAIVPVTRYAPQAAGCAPLAVLSPGAGGDERGLAWLAQFLADQGWLALVLGHRESGLAALKKDVRDNDGLHGGLLALTTDAAAYRARFMDIDAVLHWADQQCKAPYRVLLGHSMGAATVMLEAGAKNQLDLHPADVFDAYVALSPQGPGSLFPPHAWAGIHKPVLMLTGTRDKALEGDWQTRTLPYADLPPGCKWLGVIEGSSHMNFAGGGFSRKTEALGKSTIQAFLAGARQGRCTALPTNLAGMTLDTK